MIRAGRDISCPPAFRLKIASAAAHATEPAAEIDVHPSATVAASVCDQSRSACVCISAGSTRFSSAPVAYITTSSSGAKVDSAIAMSRRSYPPAILSRTAFTAASVIASASTVDSFWMRWMMPLRHAGFSDACISTVKPILAPLPVRIHGMMAFPWTGSKRSVGMFRPTTHSTSYQEAAGIGCVTGHDRSRSTSSLV